MVQETFRELFVSLRAIDFSISIRSIILTLHFVGMYDTSESNIDRIMLLDIQVKDSFDFVRTSSSPVSLSFRSLVGMGEGIPV